MDTSKQLVPASTSSGKPAASPQQASTDGQEEMSAFHALDRIDLLVVLVLVGLLLFYFRSLLWTDTFIYGELDIRRSIYLFRKVSYELLQGGHLPLWMPYIYCGMPLLGSFLATPFYPLDLLFAFTNVPLHMAFNWDLLIHLIAAQIFSYLFFRHLLKKRIAAIFCSMWFWNIFFLNSITIGDALNIRAMLLVPMVFYFLQVALSQNRQSRWFLLLSCAVSLQILSGGVQFAFYTLAAAAAYTVFTLLFQPLPMQVRVRLFLSFVVALALAVALAGIQLLPQWEYSRLSIRAMRHDWYRIWGVQPRQLLNYLFPSAEELGYLGIVPLLLALFSLLFWNSKQKYFFALLGLISILYALGGSNPISAFLANFPLLRDFRGPFRAALFFNFSVYALAGGALTSSLETTTQLKKKRKLIIAAVLTSLCAIGLWISAGAAKKLLEVNSIQLSFSVLMAALSIPAIYLLLFSHRQKQISALALISLLAFDLGFHYGTVYSPARVFHLFRKDETARLLEQSRESRILVLNTAEANYFGLFGIKSANGHHPFPLLRHLEFLSLLTTSSYDKVASLAGIKYILDFNPSGKTIPSHPPVSNQDEVVVQKMPLEPLPLAFLVTGVHSVKNSADALSAIQHDFDPGTTVVLEQNQANLESSDPDLESRAKIVSSEANRVVIQTKSRQESVLVRSETYYPGWRARIDGNDVEVLRADYVFQAVPVPAGEHLVDFEFKPQSVVWGAAVSCLGIAGLMGWALASIIKRKLPTQTPGPLPQQ